jgi:hypothetical protein
MSTPPFGPLTKKDRDLGWGCDRPNKCTMCDSEAHRGMFVCAKCYGYITRGCPIVRRGSNEIHNYSYTLREFK